MPTPRIALDLDDGPSKDITPKFKTKLARYLGKTAVYKRFTELLSKPPQLEIKFNLPSRMSLTKPEEPGSLTATVNKPEPRPVLPAYSWREKSIHARLFYVRDHTEANAIVTRLGRGPLGFDLEWRPNFVKGRPENPVAVVQLSSQDTIVLFQVSAMQEFPSGLKEILEDPGIPKAGVGIQNDCKKIYRDWRIQVRHCLDLSLLARCVDNARWKGKYTQPIGLSHLLEIYEKFSLPKGKVQRSNWTNELDDLQQDYAANDAHAGFVIYEHLSELAQSLPADKIPKKIYYTFDSIGGSLLEPSAGIKSFSAVKYWSPENPDYDPGPPPPPRPPKPPKFPTASHVVDTSTPATPGVGGANLYHGPLFNNPAQGSRSSPKPRSRGSRVVHNPRHYSASGRGRGRGSPRTVEADGQPQSKRPRRLAN